MRTLETNTTYQQLEAVCLPLIQQYQSDLTKIDKASIEQWQGIPFIHWTRDYGTYIIFLFTPDHEVWPANGCKIPYLFGDADREHILRENAGIAAYYAKDVNRDQIRAVHHFDGVKLRKITLEKAVEIANQWRDATNAAWNK